MAKDEVFPVDENDNDVVVTRTMITSPFFLMRKTARKSQTILFISIVITKQKMVHLP